MESEKISKMERLACLFLTFLNHPGGLSLKRIQSMMPLAYGGEKETARRKFERDKEDLRTLGMNLEHFDPGMALPGGKIAEEHIYIPKDELLPINELSLSKSEATDLAAILVDSMLQSENEQEKDALESALMKLLYKFPESLISQGGRINVSLPTEMVPKEQDFLETIHRAISKKQVMEIRYAGENQARAIHGRGLVSHRGRWCLIAYCERSKAIRSFYIDRMDSCALLEKPVKVDPSFQIKDYSLHPVCIRIHEKKQIRLDVEKEYLDLWLEYLSGTPSWIDLNVQGNSISFNTTNQNALIQFILRNPDSVAAIEEELRVEIEKYLDSLKMLYQVKVQ